MHARVLEALLPFGVVKRLSPRYHKFLIHSDTTPAKVKPLPVGFKFAKVRPQDFALVRSHTHIPRRDHTLMLIPSAAVVHVNDDADDNEGGQPLAWVFEGLDASLTSLHCEEGFRGRGLAKAVVGELFRRTAAARVGVGEEWVGHSDVMTDNLGSIAVAKALGGVLGWDVYWVYIDLEKVGRLHAAG